MFKNVSILGLIHYGHGSVSIFILGDDLLEVYFSCQTVSSAVG